MLMQLSGIFGCLPFVGWFVPCFSEEFGTNTQESPAKRSSCLLLVSCVLWCVFSRWLLDRLFTMVIYITRWWTTSCNQSIHPFRHGYITAKKTESPEPRKDVTIPPKIWPCLGFIRDYTTKLYGDNNTPFYVSLLNNQYNGISGSQP